MALRGPLHETQNETHAQQLNNDHSVNILNFIPVDTLIFDKSAIAVVSF